MAGPHLERIVVKILVATALCSALAASILMPIPTDASGDPALPAPAFKQTGLYRLEVALMVFYGGLLLATPAISGLAGGRLPTEISTRGAKFAEGADHSATVNEARIKELERATKALSEGLTTADIQIQRLKEASHSDTTQQAVSSKP